MQLGQQASHTQEHRSLHPSIIIRHGGRSGMAFRARIIPPMPRLICCWRPASGHPLCTTPPCFASGANERRRALSAHTATASLRCCRQRYVSGGIRAAKPPWLAGLISSYPNPHLIPSPNPVQRDAFLQAEVDQAADRESSLANCAASQLKRPSSPTASSAILASGESHIC